jgi:ArsR family transcriptional regulator, arsenate/arsenite/antimonite-responsive transcriptional repressor
LATPKINSIFQAIRDPVRREILDLLNGNELTATGIATVIFENWNISHPAVSSHLDILKRSGLVVCRRQGVNLIYSQDREAFTALIDWAKNHGLPETAVRARKMPSSQPVVDESLIFDEDELPLPVDASVFRAIADPVRRGILEILHEKELNATDVAQEVFNRWGISRPAVSKHLSILKDAGLVTNRREKMQQLYSKNVGVFTQFMQWADGLGLPVHTIRKGLPKRKGSSKDSQPSVQLQLQFNSSID